MFNFPIRHTMKVKISLSGGQNYWTLYKVVETNEGNLFVFRFINLSQCSSNIGIMLLHYFGNVKVHKDIRHPSHP